jgi:Zn-dependent peptidase ImmA (M78 family)
MKILELLVEDDSQHHDNFVEMFKKFLPVAMQYIELEKLPTMKFSKQIDDDNQPTFGMYNNDEHTLLVALKNRHPNDILRTIAHELVHFKQGTTHSLKPDSGATGSPEENEAHAIAGVVMRHFNKQYPEYLNSTPMMM